MSQNLKCARVYIYILCFVAYYEAKGCSCPLPLVCNQAWACSLSPLVVKVMVSIHIPNKSFQTTSAAKAQERERELETER